MTELGLQTCRFKEITTARVCGRLFLFLPYFRKKVRNFCLQKKFLHKPKVYVMIELAETEKSALKRVFRLRKVYCLKEKYRTVSQEASGEITEKRSRFIAAVKPVRTEDEATAFIEELRKKYWDARHNVFAYIIEENGIMRYSDDGEPAGTAGLPVLDCIKKEGLSNIAVVVTRYFGGILLGTGGLVHAYSKAAKEGIAAALPVDMALCTEVSLFCDYTLLGKIQNELCRGNVLTGDTVYTDSVKVCAFVPVSDTENFVKNMTDKTNGQVRIEIGKTGYKKYI